MIRLMVWFFVSFIKCGRLTLSRKIELFERAYLLFVYSIQIVWVLFCSSWSKDLKKDQSFLFSFRMNRCLAFEISTCKMLYKKVSFFSRQLEAAFLN